MPWKVTLVSGVRLAFVLAARSLNTPVAALCRQFGISRKTGYKWLKRYALAPSERLADRSRRPAGSPASTDPALVARALELRDRHGWGPRKLKALLAPAFPACPSVRTVANILARNGRVPTPAFPAAVPQRFERVLPNQLWQCDFKGPLEVARTRVTPFSLLDDHSRFLLALTPCTDQTMLTAWNILWSVFGDVGLPEALLCDNAFGRTGPHSLGISWFDSQLVRLGIAVCHGRPYHPQTQGKIERLHGTLERELWPTVRRDTLDHFAADCQHWRNHVYNSLRPHEALGDKPPLTRWRPSLRRRHAALPPVEYAP